MPNQYNKCDKENIIQQLLEVQAQITVTPIVRHDNPKVYCIDSCIQPKPDCGNQDPYNRNCCDCSCCNKDFCPNATRQSGCSKNQYNYTLTQLICIEIPIYIDADVNVKDGIACCGRPDVMPIKEINKTNNFTCK